jgi:trehalose-6-phosphate synthase
VLVGAKQVGWFLHTPFPSSEIYRTLPVREEVLRAVLKADLIGFHTYDYARHFVSACTRILGLEVGPVLALPCHEDIACGHCAWRVVPAHLPNCLVACLCKT